MYDYQEKTFEYLSQVSEKLETITEAKMSLKIGFIREDFHHGNGEFSKQSGDLYLLVNYGNTFRMVNNNGYYSISDDFDIVDSTSFVRFDSNLISKLTDWIGGIYSNKDEREKFHEKLNQELECIVSMI